MKRRDFLTSLVGRAAGAGLLAAAGLEGKTLAPQRRRSRGRATRPPTSDKRSRIGISTWSFHNLFPKTRDQDATATGKNLVLMDFPEMIADRYKVHNLEFVAPHFASTEPTYLQELKGKLLRAQSHLVNIPVDIEEIWNAGGLSDPEPRIRETAINASMKWIDIAKQLSARSVRCDPGKMNPDDLTPTIDSYQKLAAYGRSRGIYVIIENHGGVGSEHPEELVELFKGVGGDFIGAPRFRQFPRRADAYARAAAPVPLRAHRLPRQGTGPRRERQRNQVRLCQVRRDIEASGIQRRLLHRIRGSGRPLRWRSESRE